MARFANDYNEQSSLLATAGTAAISSNGNYQNNNNNNSKKNSLSLLFEKPSPTDDNESEIGLRSSNTIGVDDRRQLSSEEDGQASAIHQDSVSRWRHFWSFPGVIPSCSVDELQSTFVGSTVFLLYQVVFCLAQAATITRPHASHSNTGVMAQMAALGIMTAGPLFLWELADQVPAIYPASDLFLAPFLAGLAQTIDEVLWEHGLQDEDSIFLATFGMLLATAFLLSGALCVLAARVKLANLGAFLPYSVLCGFFTTIGILMWTLGFSVDVGQKIGPVLTSGDWKLMGYAVKHHLPSLGVGIIMHILGPKNPLYVILLVCSTVLGSYIIMAMTGTTLAEAQAENWFFSATDLIPRYPTLSWDQYALPAPFGLWVSIWRGDVYWEAYMAGMPMMLALVVLYLVRCSLHSAALKKNIPQVTRKTPSSSHSFDDDNNSIAMSVSLQSTSERLCNNKSSSSSSPSQQPSHATASTRKQQLKKKKTPLTLNFILEHGYGYSQLLNGLVGGIAIAPSVAASLTLFKLRAETPPPQYGSCFLVLLFYCSNFTLVQYIPKPAFSSLMVLAGLDMVRTWIVDSYHKTKAKVEWFVGPVLVVLSFTIGVLNAIFVGVAISTFIFAANFYNAGAVKFIGSGLTLRSAVERGVRESDWLDQHGDWIQILVVQNYLFFGNCQSLVNFITTMFDDDDDDDENDDEIVANQGGDEGKEEEGKNVISILPPKPKHLVLDFSLVSGMDTSAVDIIKEIVALCSHESNRCRLYLSGLRPSLRSNLLYAGLKSSTRSTSTSVRRCGWMYTQDMETALAKAEDALLSTEFHLEELDREEFRRRQQRSNISSLVVPSIRRNGSTEYVDIATAGANGASTTTTSTATRMVDDGFLYALRKIDEIHGLRTSIELADLAPWTQPLELQAGDVLSRGDATEPGGLYFVETGLLRVQWSASNKTTTRYRSDNSGGRVAFGGRGDGREHPSDVVGGVGAGSATDSIGHLHARSATIGREMARWKEQHQMQADAHHRSLPPQQQQQQPQYHDHHQLQSFRLARMGQGWIIGSIEVVNGMKKPGVLVAISACRLHYLSHEAIEKLQETKVDDDSGGGGGGNNRHNHNSSPPAARLAMHLYRTLAYLATKRQEMTIDHLEQHLRILQSPVPRLRAGRGRLGLAQESASLLRQSSGRAAAAVAPHEYYPPL